MPVSKDGVEIIDGGGIVANFISLEGMSREQLEAFVNQGNRIANNLPRYKKSLADKTVYMAFFEASYRTWTAMYRAALDMGANVINVPNPGQSTSLAKGEDVISMFRLLHLYANCAIVRHPVVGFCEKIAAGAPEISLVNAGDGMGGHPTQTVGDLGCILTDYEAKGRRIDDGLSLIIGGDLGFSRVINSLLKAIVLYPKVKVTAVSSPELALPEEIRGLLRRHRIKLEECSEFETDSLNEADAIYLCRDQKERWPTALKQSPPQASIRFTRSMLDKTPDDCILMHPLPNGPELADDLKFCPKAVFETKQPLSCLRVRRAILGYAIKGVDFLNE